MRKNAIGLIVAALLVTALPASAEDVPEIGPLTTYFHCAGTVRAQNALTAQAPPSWNTTAPTLSVQDNAGCTTADPGSRTGTNQENVYDGVFKGSFTGNLDSLTLRLYDIGVGAARTGAAQELAIRVSVDGKSMFGTYLPPESPLDAVSPRKEVPVSKTLTVTPKSTNSGATNYLELTVTGLGFVSELGTGIAEREILVTVNSLSEAGSAWAFDTTEVPGGISFNPTAPAAASIAATTPGPPAEES
jgi:hypothetical protein